MRQWKNLVCLAAGALLALPAVAQSVPHCHTDAAGHTVCGESAAAGYSGSGLSPGQSHSRSGLQYPAASGDSGQRDADAADQQKDGDADGAYPRLRDRPDHRLNCYSGPNDTYCR